MEKKEIEIFPNRLTSGEKLRINGANGLTQIVVYEYTGRMVDRLEIDANEGGLQIDTDVWPKGLLILKIETREKISTFKVVID